MRVLVSQGSWGTVLAGSANGLALSRCSQAAPPVQFRPSWGRSGAIPAPGKEFPLLWVSLGLSLCCSFGRPGLGLCRGTVL